MMSIDIALSAMQAAMKPTNSPKAIAGRDLWGMINSTVMEKRESWGGTDNAQAGQRNQKVAKTQLLSPVKNPMLAWLAGFKIEMPVRVEIEKVRLIW
jgi:hypothetical protein